MCARIVRKARLGLGLVALAVVALVALAACGSTTSHTATSAGGASSAATGTSSAATGASTTANKSPLTVFEIYEQGSPEQDYHTLNGGAAAAIRSINLKGGLAGHPMKLVACDDNSDPNRAVLCARQAIQDKAWAVIASSTLYTSAAGPILAAAKIPYVGGWLNSAYDATNKNGFPIAPLGQQAFQGTAYSVEKAGAKKIAIVELDVPAVAALGTATQVAIKKSGAAVGPLVLVPPTATDNSSYAEAVKSSGSDGVVIISSQAGVVSFIKAAQDLGLKLHYGIEAGDYPPSVLKSLGAAVNSLTAAGYWPPSANPGNSAGAKQFVADIKAAEAAHVKNATQTAVAINGWVDPWALYGLVQQSPQAVDSPTALISAMDNNTKGARSSTSRRGGQARRARLRTRG